MAGASLLIPWFAVILYSSVPLFWFLVHPLAPRWRRKDRSPYRVLLPVWILLIAGLSVLAWPWREQTLYASPWMWLASLIFFIPGVIIYARIKSGFGTKRFTGENELRPEAPQQLIVSGLHSRMRHPIYVGHLSMFTGWVAGSGLTMGFVLLGIAVLLTFPLMIWLEERELRQRFGDEFLRYKSRVPLIPLRRPAPEMDFGASGRSVGA